MEDNHNQMVKPRNMTGKGLYKKIIILTMIMTILIVIVAVSYLVSYLTHMPSVKDSQSAMSVITVNPTDDPCSDTVIDVDSSQCVANINKDAGTILDFANNL